MAKGILYILTNDAMDKVIKIGKTKTSVEQRMKELDTTGVPLPFRCYYAVEVDDVDSKEKKVHDIFADYRLRPNREFFTVNAERVVSALSMLGEEIKLSNDMIDQDGNVIATPQQPSGSNKKRFDFSAYEIPAGAELVFTRDHAEKCTVAPDMSNVIYDGKSYSLSKLAKHLMEKRGYKWSQYRGPSFFEYKEKLLSDIKSKLDAEEE